jgi:hypothetical protein
LDLEVGDELRLQLLQIVRQLDALSRGERLDDQCRLPWEYAETVDKAIPAAASSFNFILKSILTARVEWV